MASPPGDPGFHLRVTKDGWIVLDCRACGKPVCAATHMDLGDWGWWAAEHWRKHHPHGVADNAGEDYQCPRCEESENRG